LQIRHVVLQFDFYRSFDFAIAKPGFQCEQASIFTPDNGKLQPRNPLFEIAQSLSGGEPPRKLLCASSFLVFDFQPDR